MVKLYSIWKSLFITLISLLDFGVISSFHLSMVESFSFLCLSLFHKDFKFINLYLKLSHIFSALLMQTLSVVWSCFQYPNFFMFHRNFPPKFCSVIFLATPSPLVLHHLGKPCQQQGLILAISSCHFEWAEVSWARQWSIFSFFFFLRFHFLLVPLNG